MVLLLAACTEFQHTRNKGVLPVDSCGHDACRLLEEMHETRGMSPEELEQMLTNREQVFSNDPSSCNRMRLALLLATGGESVRDRERALELLAGIKQASVTADEQELLTVLQQFLDEQHEISTKMNTLRNQVTEQGRRIEELEQQQRALTTIEQSIQQREKPAGIGDGN